MVYISTEHLKYTTFAKYYISQQNTEFEYETLHAGESMYRKSITYQLT